MRLKVEQRELALWGKASKSIYNALNCRQPARDLETSPITASYLDTIPLAAEQPASPPEHL